MERKEKEERTYINIINLCQQLFLNINMRENTVFWTSMGYFTKLKHFSLSVYLLQIRHVKMRHFWKYVERLDNIKLKPVGISHINADIPYIKQVLGKQLEVVLILNSNASHMR